MLSLRLEADQESGAYSMWGMRFTENASCAVQEEPHRRYVRQQRSRLQPRRDPTPSSWPLFYRRYPHLLA